jgi:histidinol dehydrogenase
MTRTTRILELETLDVATLDGLLDRKIWDDDAVIEPAREIVRQVRERGDAAVLELTRRFDGVDLREIGLRVGRSEIDRAAEALDTRLARSIDSAIDNIRRYHETQRPAGDRLVEVDSGVWCGERTTPIDTVCLYVPRGRGAFASVACMLAVPAKIAGVGRIVICTPPGADGSIDPATLYAARRIGIEEIYRVGGAQAVAAVAYGTETLPRCDKIVGPGNIWVSAARQLLARQIDPGPPAGPSESLIVGDGSADPDNVAWNLLIEAEHGENSCAVLVTHDRAEAEAVARGIEPRLAQLSPQRREFAAEVLSTRGGIVLTRSLDDSCRFADRFAAEHAALMVADPWDVLPRVRNAGEILVGDFPIMSLANYAMGINAILPTGGWARSTSGVSVLDFVKRTSIGFVTRGGYGRLREVVAPMSVDEGFSAHHLAIEQWKQAGRD